MFFDPICSDVTVSTLSNITSLDIFLDVIKLSYRLYSYSNLIGDRVYNHKYNLKMQPTDRIRILMRDKLPMASKESLATPSSIEGQHLLGSSKYC